MFCDAALAGKSFKIGVDGLSKVGLGEILRCLLGPPGGYIASGRTFALEISPTSVLMIIPGSLTLLETCLTYQLGDPVHSWVAHGPGDWTRLLSIIDQGALHRLLGSSKDWRQMFLVTFVRHLMKGRRGSLAAPHISGYTRLMDGVV